MLTSLDQLNPAQGEATDHSAAISRNVWTIATAVAVGVVIFVLGQLMRGGLSYWNFSEGVYALTSRLFLHGHLLYSDVVVAQPPALFLYGAGVLSLHDSLPFLRLVFSFMHLIAGLIGGRIAWRLTGKPSAMVFGLVLVMLAPWSIHEHGFILPETFAAPLILASVLLAARKNTAPYAGVILGVIALTKLPFIIFTLAIILTAAARKRVALWAIGTIAVLLVGSLAIFGAQPMYEQIVVAQQQTGIKPMVTIIDRFSQGGWNLIGLVVCSIFAWFGYRSRCLKDRPLAQTVAGAVFAGFVLPLGIIKNGTGLGTLVPTEAVLAITAATGVVVAHQFVRRSTGHRRILLGSASVVASLAALFTVAQGISVLTSSALEPHLFATPNGNAALTWRVGATEIREAVERLQSCPSGAPLQGKGAVHMAFITNRSVEADQPDKFLIEHASVLAPIRKRMKNSNDPACQALPRRKKPATKNRLRYLIW